MKRCQEKKPPLRRLLEAALVVLMYETDEKTFEEGGASSILGTSHVVEEISAPFPPTAELPTLDELKRAFDWVVS